MKLKPLALALTLGAITSLSACGAKSDNQTPAQADPPAQTTTAAAKGEAVEEYAANSSITPGDLPVVIDFNATWCGPCRRFGPVFHQVAQAWQGRARFISVDVDRNPATAQAFGVSSIPQLTVLMPDGKTQTTVGAMDQAQFEQFLTQSIKAAK